MTEAETDEELAEENEIFEGGPLEPGKAEEPEDNGVRHQADLEVTQRVALLSDRTGEVDAQRDLGELARLDLETGEAQPSLGVACP